jgi:hypothetical protein
VTAAARKIILCADDYGLSPSVNAAIRELISRRRINATTVMVLPPSFGRGEADALDALNANGKHVAVGLHVTLTAPFKPAVAGFAPLRDGAFLPLRDTLRAALARRFEPDRLAAEIAAQLQKFTEAFGRAPDFLDGHQHVQLFPQIRDAFLAVAAKEAPQAWVRQCRRSVQLAKRLRDRKGLLLDVLSVRFRAKARQLGVRTNPAFAGTYNFAPDADFAALFPTFLNGLPDGGLVMCHPGTVDAELARLDPLTTGRERELAYFKSDEFARQLADNNVVLA